MKIMAKHKPEITKTASQPPHFFRPFPLLHGRQTVMMWKLFIHFAKVERTEY